METGPLSTSELELGKRIVYMKDALKMSFRKISEVLKSEGIFDVGKDRGNRLYWKYKALGTINVVREDKELVELGELETEAEERVGISREKSERRWRIATLLVEEAEASFDRRRELFENKGALLDFAEKVLPVINPTLWLRLEKLCEIMELKLDDALQTAIGPQTEFEEIRMESLNEEERYLLDEHLCLCLEDWLSEQEKEIVEVSVTIEGENGEEQFRMQIPSRVLKNQHACPK